LKCTRANLSVQGFLKSRNPTWNLVGRPTNMIEDPA
jgi:hypothetical protein